MQELWLWRFRHDQFTLKTKLHFAKHTHAELKKAEKNRTNTQKTNTQKRQHTLQPLYDRA
jgi:hypothetical protein